MRAILSGAHFCPGQQSLEFELIDIPLVVDNLAVIFMERHTMISRCVPIKQRKQVHAAQLDIKAADYILDQPTQSNFAWEMYLTFNVNRQKYLLQVESEYVSSRRQLALTQYFQFSADAHARALFEIHTDQNADEYASRSVNVTKDGLTVIGYNQINDEPLVHQTLLVEDQQSKTTLRYQPEASPVSKPLFVVTVPMSDLSGDGPYTLAMTYDYQGQSVRQSVTMATALDGQNVAAPRSDGRVIMIERQANRTITLKSAAPLPLGHKLALVGHKFSGVRTRVHQLNISLNNRYMRWLFKRGHRPFTATTIIFESFGGRQISDSPLAIYQTFKKLYPGFRFIWSVDRDIVSYCKKNNIPHVVRGTARWVRTLEKSQYWISNARFPAWVKKPKYVTYIQTWHGTPLKKLGLDIENVSMPGTNTSAYHRNFVREANRWDALISPNDYSTQIFRSAFGFNNQILKVGYPRNDELINASQDDIVALKQRLAIPLDKKVVMYAPTYRDNQFAEKGKYTFELPFSLADFKQRFGDDAVLILRMHYLISNALDVSKYRDFVYDLSSYPNISDLYLVSDLLITDYSSVFFDYAYLQRPILFYPYDYHLYRDELRGFYLDYERDLPGKIAHNEDELLENIATGLTQSDMSQDAKFQKFYARFCAINDGQAAIKVVRYVMDQIEAHH